MTYFKSEAVNKSKSQSLSAIGKILDSAQKAAQKQDWLKVSNCLKELPQSEAKLLLESAQWQTAFDLALEMLLKADFQHKWEISKLLPSFGENLIPPLVSLVQDETTEAEVRWFICQILGSFPNQEVVLTLVELLQQTSDEELMAIAGKTLTKIGNHAIDALIDLSAQPKYRFLAVQSLYYIRTAETIEPLLKITQDPQPELRSVAVKALSSFHDPRISPVLIRALEDTASSVRKEAAIALGFRSDLCQELSLINHLQPLLFDLNLEVCRQAAVSLGRMKTQEANAALFQVLQIETTPVSLKLDLIKALGWSKISSAIDYLDKALANKSELVQQEIIITLGRITAQQLQQQSAQVLVNFWQQNQAVCDSGIKQALATSLGELRCSCAQITLEQLATDSDRKVKLHALSALKKLFLTMNNEQ